MPGKPAARLGDPTAHGGAITGPGVPTVLIGKMPAATMGDMHVCPMVTPATPPIPHVGGPITLGSTGVFIGKKPAARMGDMAVCVGPPSTVIMGCPTVMIGEAGSGSQAGSAGAAAAAAAASLKGPMKVNPLVPPERPAAPAEVASAISLVVTDSAGKPLSGVDFLLTDPDGVEQLSATASDGTYHRSGPWPSGKSYQAAFRSVTQTKIDKSELKDGDEANFSAAVQGFAAGTQAVFRLVLEGPDGESDVAVVSTLVKGEKMEAKWTYRLGQLRELPGLETVSDKDDLQVRLVAVCGFEACVGANTTKLKVDPSKPVTVRKLRSA
jgi:uncharacterized Zn-binding protein involved in type VI secretion